MKKLGTVKMLLILVSIVLANIYWGCIMTYPKEHLSAQDQIRLRELELKQEQLLQQQSQQNQKVIEELRKEIEELKKQQASPKN